MKVRVKIPPSPFPPSSQNIPRNWPAGCFLISSYYKCNRMFVRMAETD